MSTHGNKTQITSNSNYKPLTRSKELSKNLSLKVLCDIIFLLLSGMFDILSFTMAIFDLDDYHWQPNFSNYIKLKLKTSN